MKKLTILLSLILFFTFTFGFSTNSTMAASNSLIDNYVKVNSVTKNSNGTISVKYTLKKDFKTKLPYNVSQRLGFTYTMHQSLKINSVFVPVKSKKGTYTAVLPKPSPNYLGSQQVSVTWGSGGHTANKSVATVYNVPSSMQGLKRSNRVVTKTEAAGGKIVMDYVPGLTTMLIFKGKSATIKTVAQKGVGIATALVGFNLATGYFKQMPALSAGQVYYRESKINTNGKVYHRLLIFANKATFIEFKNSSYKKSKLAIYDVSSTSTLKY